MTTVDTRGAQFNDRGEVFAAEELSAAEEGSRDGGLVLPQEVVADLAGQLGARARGGGRVGLAGRGGRVPRDRAGTFEPALIPKGVRRTAGISDTVISLYAGGMSVRDIARHCQRTMG